MACLTLFIFINPNCYQKRSYPPDYPLERRFVATDLYLYYDPAHTSWYKRPDWFAAVGVSHLYQGDLRYSYVMWKEKVKPLIVVELLSPETEKEDLGKTRRQLRRPPTKWEVYEQEVKVPYYAIFCRRTGHFQLFQLTPSAYQEMSLPEKRFFLPEIQLGLGVWNGTYDGIEYEWLRWYDATGKWIPTALENTARERQRATQAEQRAEQLAAKLRALGIDPE
jgi:Uma2 family endonuclease